MSRACELLTSRKLAVKEVAAQCGFADQSHLTRDFTTLGVPPARYASQDPPATPA